MQVRSHNNYLNTSLTVVQYYSTDSPELYTSSVREEEEEEEEKEEEVQEDWEELLAILGQEEPEVPDIWSEYVPNTGIGIQL